MKIHQNIRNINLELHEIISWILKNKSKFKISRFHLSELPNPNGFTNFPNIDSGFRKHVQKLDDYDKDCLYWFECDNEVDAEKLNITLREYRNSKADNKNYRVVPASNRLPDKKSVMYLGVRKGHKTSNGLTNITGRINQHLGYYKEPRTQGLQLYHWAREIDVHLNFYVVHFEENLGDLLYLVEKTLANKLKPHCGRH